MPGNIPLCGGIVPDVADAIFADRLGSCIAIEVTAGSRKDHFPAGYNVWRKTIICRVSAPALEGKANKSVLNLIAGTLGVPVSSLSIQSGATSSQKRVLVAGLDKPAIVARLSSLLP
jgi:hypothetical protein